jgi:hypothetical protein
VCAKDIGLPILALPLVDVHSRDIIRNAALHVALYYPRGFEPRNSNALAHAIYNIESMRLLVGRVKPLLSIPCSYG